MAIAQQKEIARLNKVISILTTNHLALIEVLQRDLAASQQTIVELDQENEELVRSIQSLSNENSELMSHLEAEVQKSDTLVLKIYQLLDERYKLGTQDLKQSVAMHTAEVNQILKKDNPRSIIGEKRCQEQVSKLQTSQSPSFSSFVNEKDIGHVGKESKRNLPRLGDKRTLENCVGSQNSEQKNSRPVRRLSHSYPSSFSHGRLSLDNLSSKNSAKLRRCVSTNQLKGRRSSSDYNLKRNQIHLSRISSSRSVASNNKLFPFEGTTVNFNWGPNYFSIDDMSFMTSSAKTLESTQDYKTSQSMKEGIQPDCNEHPNEVPMNGALPPSREVSKSKPVVEPLDVRTDVTTVAAKAKNATSNEIFKNLQFTRQNLSSERNFNDNSVPTRSASSSSCSAVASNSIAFFGTSDTCRNDPIEFGAGNISCLPNQISPSVFYTNDHIECEDGSISNVPKHLLPSDNSFKRIQRALGRTTSTRGVPSSNLSLGSTFLGTTASFHGEHLDFGKDAVASAGTTPNHNLAFSEDCRSASSGSIKGGIGVKIKGILNSTHNRKHDRSQLLVDFGASRRHSHIR